MKDMANTEKKKKGNEEGYFMKRFAVFLLFVLLSFNALAAQINSTNYEQNVVVSAGGDNLSSSSYKTSVAIGIINRIVSSASFINRLGFFHTILLADSQQCTSANQCEGGFCCSNLCSSSACPTGTTTATSGSGGASGGGGGGGGGAIPVPEEAEDEKEDFSVNPGSIKEELALGAAKTRAVEIKNTGNVALDFHLDVTTVDDFVFISDSSFSLEPGEEKNIEANIIGKRLGSYIGEIQVRAGEAKKSVTVVIDVESEQALFDVKIDIPQDYKEVKAGTQLRTQITLLNVGPPKKVDVTAGYIIKDINGVVVYESSETFAVEKQRSYEKDFPVPKYLQPGNYLVIVELRYLNYFAVSSDLFKVVTGESVLSGIVKPDKVWISLFAVFILAMALLLYLIVSKGRIFGRKKSQK